MVAIRDNADNGVLGNDTKQSIFKMVVSGLAAAATFATRMMQEAGRKPQQPSNQAPKA